MSTVTSPYLQSTGDYKVSPMVKKLSNFTYKLSHWDHRIEASDAYKKAGPISYRLRRFGAMLTKWDIDHFNTFFKGKLAIPTNPMGMLLFILFPCVIGSRVLRAKERDKTGVEIGDVLRRDIMTLIPFVFMAPALVNAINFMKQKHDGINLVVKKDARDVIPKAFSYSELASAFDLNNAKKLESLIAEGNGKGLHQATQKTLSMYENVLNAIPEGKAVLGPYRQFAGTIAKMRAEGVALKGTMAQPKTSPTLKALSEKAYSQMTQAQKEFSDFGAKLGSGSNSTGRHQLAKFSKNIEHLPKFENSLIHYAKTRRLPADLLSILLTVVAMGWAPVAFNDYLSRRRLERMHQKVHPQPAMQNPFDMVGLMK